MNTLMGRRSEKTLNAPVTNILICSTYYLHFFHNTLCTSKTHFMIYSLLSCLGQKPLDGLSPGIAGVYFLDLMCSVCYAHRWP